MSVNITQEDLKHLEKVYENMDGYVEYEFVEVGRMDYTYSLVVKTPSGKYYQCLVGDDGEVPQSYFEDLEWKEVVPVEVKTTQYVEVE